MPELYAALRNALDHVYDLGGCAITYAYDCMKPVPPGLLLPHDLPTYSDVVVY